jgi:tRNA (mo5U34)-methyltransferase
MQLEEIIKQRQSWFEWKNIKPIKKKLDNFNAKPKQYQIKDEIIITSYNQKEEILSIAKELMPWRKGPFRIDDIFIDSEWKSFKKYNLIEPYVDLKNKIVADVGCNNGYYMFQMLRQNPKKIVGFDPSPLFNLQFDFINKFIQSNIKYELLGIEHLKDYFFKFDIIFCLGVLYHRSDIISSLKSLYDSLNKNAQLIIDTLIIEGEDEICLFPENRYCGMRNVYFLPTINALKNMLKRVGFSEIKLLAKVPTTLKEQRKTKWITGHSLNNFLHPDDIAKTVEGYPAPIRAYLKAVKIDKDNRTSKRC